MMKKMNIGEFAGSESVQEKLVGYEGDADGVREVVENAIACVQRYSQVLGSGDFEAAYALTDAGLQRELPLPKFIAVHEKAAKKWYGPCLEFLIREIAYVYADEASRLASNTSEEGWYKGTPKENRRGRMLGFWIRDRADSSGCGGGLWFASQNGEYRIAKFDFWRP
jgi:hypothetical protein